MECEKWGGEGEGRTEEWLGRELGRDGISGSQSTQSPMLDMIAQHGTFQLYTGSRAAIESSSPLMGLLSLLRDGDESSFLHRR